MKIETFCCDVCQVQKKDANRWWTAYRVAGGLSILSFHSDPPGEKDLIDEVEPAHLCGEECAMKYISKNLFHSDQENR